MRISNVAIGRQLGLSERGQALARGLAEINVPGYHLSGAISDLGAATDVELPPGYTLIQALEESKTKLLAINDSLYSALDVLQDSNTWYNLGITQEVVDATSYGVDNWHSNALRWMNDLGSIESSIYAATTIEDVDPALQGQIDKSMKLAELLAAQGVEEAATIRSDAAVSAFADFVRHTATFVVLYFTWLKELPGKSIEYVGDVVKKAVTVVDDTASGLTWAAVKPFVLAGGAIALVAFLLVKSGVKLNVPFVKLGA